MDPAADDHDDLDDCTLCYAGSFGPKEGADEEEDCKECPPGKSSDDGAESCISCEAGEFLLLCHFKITIERSSR